MATPVEKILVYLLKFQFRIEKLGLLNYVLSRAEFFKGWCAGCEHEAGSPAETLVPLEFKPKMEKIVELLLYLAHVRPDADKYQAVKFFYLADREHLARYGRPITFDNYFALWYGPVASKALDLLEGDERVLNEANIGALPFKTEVGKAKNGKPTIYIRQPDREVNRDLFSKSDLKVFDEIVEKYRSSSFDELMKLTHEHAAYKTAWNTRRKGDRAEMHYEEMIDDAKRRAALVEDLDPVSANM